MFNIMKTPVQLSPSGHFGNLTVKSKTTALQTCSAYLCSLKLEHILHIFYLNFQLLNQHQQWWNQQILFPHIVLLRRKKGEEEKYLFGKCYLVDFILVLKNMNEYIYNTPRICLYTHACIYTNSESKIDISTFIILTFQLKEKVSASQEDFTNSNGRPGSISVSVSCVLNSLGLFTCISLVLKTILF